MVINQLSSPGPQFVVINQLSCYGPQFVAINQLSSPVPQFVIINQLSCHGPQFGVINQLSSNGPILWSPTSLGHMNIPREIVRLAGVGKFITGPLNTYTFTIQ